MQFRAFQSEGLKKQGFPQTIFSFAKKDIFKLSIFQISKVLCGKFSAFFLPIYIFGVFDVRILLGFHVSMLLNISYIYLNY